MKNKKLATVLAVSATLAATGMVNQQNASADVVNSNNSVNQNSKNVQTPIDKAQAKVNEANANVTAAQKEVDTAKVEQTQSEKTLNEANSSLAKAKEVQNNAQETQTKAETNVKNAQDALKNIQAKMNAVPADIDDQIAKQTTKVTAANEQLSKATTDQAQAAAEVKNAQGIKDQAQAKVDSQNQQIRETQKQIDSNNNITLTAEYISALKNGNYSNWNQLISAFNNYVYHEAINDSRQIDSLETMTQEDWAELATFAASIINPLREQMGTQPLNVVQGSVALGKNFATQYQRHEYIDSYNVSGSVKEAAQMVGLNSYQPDSYLAMQGNLSRVVKNVSKSELSIGGLTRSFTSYTYYPVTLGSLKRDIYDFILQSLRDTNNARELLGIYSGLNGDYFAVSGADQTLYFLNISNYEVNSGFSTTKYNIPDLDTKALQVKLAELKKQLPSLSAKLTQATDDLTSKQADKAKADEKVNALTTAVQNDQTALDNLKSQKATKINGTKDLATATQKLKDATAKYDEAKKNYDNAKKAFEEAQLKVNQASALKKTSDQKLATAQAKLKQAQDELAKAEQNLATVSNLYNVHEVFEDGHWRLYNGIGQKLIGFQTISSQNKTVFYDKNGNMLYGQQNIDGKWYNFDRVTGAMSKGLTYLSDQNKTVLYDENGQMQYGQHKVKGNWYLFDAVTGAMQTGLQYVKDQNATFYYNDQGQRQYGQRHINGQWYLFDAVTGAMKTGFQYIPEQNKTVYYNAKGEMQYGEKNIKGQWYLFDTWDGHMYSGWTKLKDGRVVYYDVNRDGTGRGMLHGVQTVKENGKNVTYYFDTWDGAKKSGVFYNSTTKQLNFFDQAKNGALLQDGTAKLGNKIVQADKDGSLVMKDGEQAFNGNWYLYDAKNKQVVVGLTKLADGRTVYYDPKTAVMYHGEKNIDGHWYYFDNWDGHMAKGLTRLPDGRMVLYNNQGQMLYGEQYVNGGWRYFDKVTGKMVTGWYTLPDKRTVYYANDGKMIHGFTKINGWLVHFDEVNGSLTRYAYVWYNGQRYYARGDGGLTRA